MVTMAMTYTGDARCAYCNKAMSDTVVLRKCSGCLTAMYCCREHQRLDWSAHRPFCQSAPWRNVSMRRASSSSLFGPSARSGDSAVTGRDAPVGYGLGDDQRQATNAGVPAEGTQAVLASTADFSSDQTVVSSYGHSDPVLAEIDHMYSDRKCSSGDDAVGPQKVDHFLNRPLVLVQPILSSSSSSSVVGMEDTDRQCHRRQIVAYMCNALQKYGWGVVDGFVEHKLADDCLKEIKALLRGGKFSEGRLSQEGRCSIEFRSDLICWYSGAAVTAQNLSLLTSETDSLVISLSAHLATLRIKGRSQAMISCYPGDGSKYVRHVDNPGSDGRVLTVITYLNHDWDASCGGALRLFPQSSAEPIVVEPIFNRMLFFWSDLRNPHEVLPAYRDRFAVTVWYFDIDKCRGIRA